MTRPELPPGPRAPALVQAARFGKSPYAYLSECARDVGDPFTLQLPGDPPRVVYSDPALVKQTFALRAEDIRVEDQAFPLNLGERALLFLDGERHRKDRLMMTPHLHGERLRSYAAVMSESTGRAVAPWREGERIGLQTFLQELTLDIILRCVFGFTEADRLRAPLAEWIGATLTPFVFFASMAVGSARLRHWLDDLVATAGRTREADTGARDALRRLAFDRISLLRGARAKAELLKVLRDEVALCRANGSGGRTDVLALLSEARYEDGSSMDPEAIVDELVTLLVGGHETTSNTIAWVLVHVLARPDVAERIARELDAVFGTGAVDPFRTDELVYLDACIKEAMRMTPIAPAIPRPLARDLTFGDYDLRKGTILWPSVYLAHHRADLWPDPHRFDPDRFVENPSASKNAFFPFGGGRRACLGMAFATLEMRIVLAELFARWELRPAEGASVAPEFRGMTIAPSARAAMIVGRRRGPTTSREKQGARSIPASA